jgi:DNA-nicking Smr family endonuclease
MKKSGVKAAKIIHGYGSTGKGGRLRKATIKLLEESKTNGLIKEFVIGTVVEV